MRFYNLFTILFMFYILFINVIFCFPSAYFLLFLSEQKWLFFFFGECVCLFGRLAGVCVCALFTLPSHNPFKSKIARFKAEHIKGLSVFEAFERRLFDFVLTLPFKPLSLFS